MSTVEIISGTVREGKTSTAIKKFVDLSEAGLKPIFITLEESEQGIIQKMERLFPEFKKPSDCIISEKSKFTLADLSELIYTKRQGDTVILDGLVMFNSDLLISANTINLISLSESTGINIIITKLKK